MSVTTRPLGAKRLVKNANLLLQAAGMPVDPGLLIGVVRSSPASPAEADAGPSTGLCAYCLLNAEPLAKDRVAYRRFKALATFFLDELPQLSANRRKRLTRDVVAVLMPLVEA